MKDLLQQLVQGHALSAEQTASAFELIMTGEADAAQTGALLAMIQQRGPTADELVGASRVMRAKALCVTPPDGLRVIDTCGTGGDHTPTFNISTAAAIVAAAVARPNNVAVAKHGNKTVTRSSGSSQGIEALGVKLAVPPEVLTRCLDEAGICFCFAPAHHPAMKHVGPIRMALGIRTMFNLLGPLTNPAGATGQVIGVADPDLTELLADVLRQLGCRRAMIVHGYKGDDKAAGFNELSIAGPTRVTELVGDNIDTDEVDAADLGLARAPMDALLVADPAASAAVMRRVFAGETGPIRDVVLLNAAAALRVADLCDDWATGVAQAAAAIDDGGAQRALDKLIALTNG